MKNKVIGKFVAGMTVASMLTYYSAPVFAYINEETVYSKLNESGKSYKTTVTTITENKDETKTIQSVLDEKLPIDCEISYYLDGKEMSVKDIVGKSGRVTVKLDYKNNEINSVKIDGKEDKMYTPFVVISGVVLDLEKNKNVEVSNGKIITNGNKTVAVGIALPGLKESLAIDTDILRSSVEISMDTENFEMGNIISYATPKIFGDFDISLDDFNEIFDKVDELQSASSKIEEGSKELSDGIITLNDGALSLNDGTKALDEGIDTLKSGAESLNNGAITLRNGTKEYTERSQEFNSAMNQVSNGVSSLNSQYSQVNDGISTLNNSSKELNGGAQKVEEGAKSISDNLDYISGLLNNVSSGASVLYEGVNSAQSGIGQIVKAVSDQVNNSKSEENIQKMQGMQEVINKDAELIAQYQALLNNIEDKTSSEYQSTASILAILQANYAALTGASSTISSTSNSVGELYSSLTQLQQGISSLKNGSETLAEGLSQISSGTSSLANGSKELVAGTKSLSQGTAALSEGTENLAAGSSMVVDGINTLDNGTKGLNSASNSLLDASKTISNGAKELQDGTASMVNGVGSLSSGSKELRNGTYTLTEGTSKLVSGATELNSGIHKFNTDGINTITELVNKDLKNTIQRIEKLEELSKDYTTFASDDKRDDIKFIAITDSIKMNNSSENDKKDNKSKK